MNETPKKIVDSRGKCFLCSKEVLNNNKTYIFGRSAIDIGDLIKTAVDEDVNKYSASDDLFICKSQCYKRLVKLKGALNKCEEIKNELRENFNSGAQLRRTKRLLCSDATNSSVAIPMARTICKASKSIKFTYDPTPTSVTLDSLIHPQLHLPLPLSSSTPNGKVSKSDVSGTVKIIINHPSKTVNKILADNYKALGKALFYGPPSRIATAVMKCDPVRKQVVQKVLGIVSREVGKLCSGKNPSMLRKTSKDDLVKFSLEDLCEDWKEKAPLFYSFLLTSCVTKSTRDVAWLPSIAVSGSVLLKQRNGEMSATAYMLGILMKSRSTEVSVGFFYTCKYSCPK